MKFLKENSYDIVKLFINQVGIMIFGLVLYLSAGMASGDLLRKLMYIFSIFATLFYCMLLYTAAWDMGSRDMVRIEAGKLKRVRAKGVILSLLANIPNLVIAILSVIFSAIDLSTGVRYFKDTIASLLVVMHFILSPFHGIVQLVTSSITDGALFAMWESSAFLIMLLIPVVATQLGYSFGMRNIRMFGFASSKKQNKE